MPLFCSPSAASHRAHLHYGGGYHLISGFWNVPGAFERIETELQFEERAVILFGRSVMQPRLVAWAGEHAYSYSGDTLLPRPFGNELTKILAAVNEQLARIAPDAPAFNHVLANFYRDGSDSMGLHADNEPELGPNPWIASVSLGAPRCFQIVPQRRHRKKGEPTEKVSLSLTDGTLFVMEPPMQNHYLHGIQKTQRLVGSRLSLTFRAILA
jgi:alkylated DNA repair dioxygenase AlkB